MRSSYFSYFVPGFLGQSNPTGFWREGKRLPRGTRWAMLKRMAYLVGVLGVADDRSRLRAALGWTGSELWLCLGIYVCKGPEASTSIV